MSIWAPATSNLAFQRRFAAFGESTTGFTEGIGFLTDWNWRAGANAADFDWRFLR
jgi:hypothetical protein